jgi:hypothetical protein
MDIRRDARKVAWCEASRSSSAHGLQVREEVLRDRARNISSGRASSAAVRIRRAPLVRDSHPAQEWVYLRELRLLRGLASPQVVLRRAVRGSPISRVIKKAR